MDRGSAGRPRATCLRSWHYSACAEQVGIGGGQWGCETVGTDGMGGRGGRQGGMERWRGGHGGSVPALFD